MIRRKKLLVAIGVALSIYAFPTLAATPQNWVTNYDSTTYAASGTITFNDWGYKGPTGVGAMDFQVGSGFDASRLGQTQNVMTVGPDLKTSDPSKTVYGDLSGTPTFSNASMDGNVNFWKWGYTTPTSYFNNMQIDKAGNYHVAKSDMQFGFYDTFSYHDTTNTNPDSTFDTNINFQPYAISDAKGWCGSTLVQNPNGLAVMAGQVKFDFAFDAYMSNQKDPTDVPDNTQIVPGFVMRSYGDYTINVTKGTTVQSFTGHAVGNNTNPESIVAGVGGTLDANFQNRVSFLGGGVVPKGVWVYNEGDRNNLTVAPDQSVPGTTAGQVRASDGAVWHVNSFAGYAFLLRADAERTLTWISPTGHSDYVTTDAAAYTSIGQVVPAPVPAAVWLFGSGLLGLGGMATRRRRQSVQ